MLYANEEKSRSRLLVPSVSKRFHCSEGFLAHIIDNVSRPKTPDVEPVAIRVLVDFCQVGCCAVLADHEIAAQAVRH